MSRELSLLHPGTRRKVTAWLDECRSKGYNVLVYETFRTEAEQDALYAQGRTKPGSVVTNASGASYLSCHQWGIAVDFCQNKAGDMYPEPFMTEVAGIAKRHGLDWGGGWTSLRDKPHLQDRDFLQGGQSPKPLIAKYGAGKAGFEAFKKTWESEEV